MHRASSIRHLGTIACASTILALAACGGGTEEPADNTAAQAHAGAAATGHEQGHEQVQAAAHEQSAAMRIAASGHGKVFDANHKLIAFSTTLISTMQESARAAVLQSLNGKLSQRASAFLKEGDALLASKDIVQADKQLLNGGLIWLLLQEAPKLIKADLEWRNEVISSKILPLAKRELSVVHPRVLDLLKRMQYTDHKLRFPELFKTYEQRCDEAGVPVPPNWAETGTAWVYQGALRVNLLSPGQYAGVWTYSDPVKRGACVALPRGSGTPGNFAGIICQSASTGQACYWDNILKTSIPEAPMGWSGLTLEITKLKNGSNLASPCTQCHRGDNVYLITPTDATWAKLLRPDAAGVIAVGPNFTTRVEASTDSNHLGPRYIPLTQPGGRTGWQNTLDTTTGGCATCHELPAAGIVTRLLSTGLPLMPPSCTASAPSGCYGW